MAANDVTCSVRRSSKVWDNAAMESFFSSLQTERVARKIYRTRNQPRPRCSTTSSASAIRPAGTRPGYLSPIDFERRA